MCSAVRLTRLQPSVGLGKLTSDLIASKGALSKVAAKKVELTQHGVSTENLDAKCATAAIKRLINNDAFRLNADVAPPLGLVALHSTAPASVAEPHPSAVPTPAPRKSRGSLSPSKSPRVQSTRSERALQTEEAALASGVHVSLREHIADDPILSVQYTDAFKCCILRRCIRYSEYRMTGQYPHLEHREWNKVVALCLRYIHDLLHRKYLPLSRLDAQRVHDDLRAHREGMDWRSHGLMDTTVAVFASSRRTASGLFPVSCRRTGRLTWRTLRAGTWSGSRSGLTTQADDAAGSLSFAGAPPATAAFTQSSSSLR